MNIQQPKDKRSILLSHSGKQHAYQLASNLQKLGRLSRFVTSSYFKEQSFPDRYVAKLSPRLRNWLEKRRIANLDDDSVLRMPYLEIPELLSRALIGNGEIAKGFVNWRDATFDRIVAKTQMHNVSVYWGFQGSCLESLRAARHRKILSIIELSTAHVTTAERVLGEEATKHPEWASTISNFRYPNWYRERLEKEPHEADVCVVASTFSRNSLLEVSVPPEKIVTLPLGADLEKFTFAERSQSGNLEIAFVGGIGQRKGIKYLLEAIKLLNTTKIRLRLCGPLPPNHDALNSYSNYFEYVGKKDTQGVVQFLHSCHTLVLPSVFEGFGLVIPEAMATGIPVIASTHTAGPEIIQDGSDGFVISPDDVSKLAQTIDWMASHRTALIEMGGNAHRKAQDFSWESHCNRIETLLQCFDRHPRLTVDGDQR